MKLLDLAGPLQVFSDVASEPDQTSAYECSIVSLDGGVIESDTLLPISTVRVSELKRQKIDTFIVVGGGGAHVASLDKDTLEAVTMLAAKSDRLASVCTGAFLLAACNLLDGRRAVTHWESCNLLATSYPNIQVEPDPIYIQDGNVWTSAGVTAGIDLALAMVSEDLGRGPALTIARCLVTYVVRPGGQSQFSAALSRQNSDTTNRFDDLHGWVLENLNTDLRVETLAEHCNMSPRNFSRLYTELIGTTPAKAIESMRAEVAQQLLEETNYPITKIARLCGFGDDERMRRVFVRLFRVPPSHYRQRFKSIA